jgi:hypothetical protein
VDHDTIEGRWPDDAALAPTADVVVCHHVVYNVPAIAAFATELTAHARRRVVVELTGRHPRFGVNHLWRHFWDLERPTGPTADDAVAALVDAGIQPQVERSPRVPRQVPTLVRVASVRKYLCLPADRDPEIEALLGDEPELAGEVVTLWWDGGAPD